jgi:hypothetical protein
LRDRETQTGAKTEQRGTWSDGGQSDKKGKCDKNDWEIGREIVRGEM